MFAMRAMSAINAMSPKIVMIVIEAMSQKCNKRKNCNEVNESYNCKQSNLCNNDGNEWMSALNAIKAMNAMTAINLISWIRAMSAISAMSTISAKSTITSIITMSDMSTRR